MLQRAEQETRASLMNCCQYVSQQRGPLDRFATLLQGYNEFG